MAFHLVQYEKNNNILYNIIFLIEFILVFPLKKKTNARWSVIFNILTQNKGNNTFFVFFFVQIIR